MRADVPELLFPTRDSFRAWLKENAETSEGVWLVFGKMKAVITLSASDALQEALCFGWIDGQMRSIDETKYHKYFTRRHKKSVWSEKNKKIVGAPRQKGMMTELGERTVEIAKTNGIWNAPKDDLVINEQETAFLAICQVYHRLTKTFAICRRLFNAHIRLDTFHSKLRKRDNVILRKSLMD
jgi:uncharacterized protein YdeI (YjbR/CyaY-like superfamily)